jgi:hypothetical protein
VRFSYCPFYIAPSRSPDRSKMGRRQRPRSVIGTSTTTQGRIARYRLGQDGVCVVATGLAERASPARTLAKSSVTGGRPARHLEGSRAVNGCGILRQLSSPARRKSDAVATRDWNLTWTILRARQRTGPRVRRPPLAVTAYLLRRSAAAAGRPDRMQACHHLVPGAGRDFSSFPRGA